LLGGVTVAAGGPPPPSREAGLNDEELESSAPWGPQGGSRDRLLVSKLGLEEEEGPEGEGSEWSSHGSEATPTERQHETFWI